MPEVTTSLGPLYVDEVGSGSPVVMWPSLFCDGTSLHPQAEELARDHRVLVIDPPRARAYACAAGSIPVGSHSASPQ